MPRPLSVKGHVNNIYEMGSTDYISLNEQAHSSFLLIKLKYVKLQNALLLHWMVCMCQELANHRM